MNGRGVGGAAFDVSRKGNDFGGKKATPVIPHLQSRRRIEKALKVVG